MPKTIFAGAPWNGSGARARAGLLLSLVLLLRSCGGDTSRLDRCPLWWSIFMCAVWMR
jgi:hypothetical protein